MPVGAASAQPRPTVDKLVAAFDDVVFGAEYDQTMRAKSIHKWLTSLRVKVEGEPRDLHIQYLRDHLSEIGDLTGLSIEPTENNGGTAPENITVLFLPAAKMDKVRVPQVSERQIRTLAASRGCYFLSFRLPPNEITTSVIVVNNQRTSRAINHCLLEELTQSLGFPNDSELIRPSLFSESDSVTSFTRSDEILVRAMYDPRLLPGTPRLEALKVVRGIIEELDSTLPLD